MVDNISITERYIYNPYIIGIVFWWYFVSATFMSFNYFLVEKLIFKIRLNSVVWVVGDINERTEHFKY